MEISQRPKVFCKQRSGGSFWTQNSYQKVGESAERIKKETCSHWFRLFSSSFLVYSFGKVRKPHTSQRKTMLSCRRFLKSSPVNAASDLANNQLGKALLCALLLWAPKKKTSRHNRPSIPSRNVRQWQNPIFRCGLSILIPTHSYQTPPRNHEFRGIKTHIWVHYNIIQWGWDHL